MGVNGTELMPLEMLLSPFPQAFCCASSTTPFTLKARGQTGLVAR